MREKKKMSDQRQNAYFPDHNNLRNATDSFGEDLSGKRCLFYGQAGAAICMIQPMDDHDEEVRENELRLISKGLEIAPGRSQGAGVRRDAPPTDLSGSTPFVHVSVKISNWSHELSPWKAPAIYRGMAFGDGAPETLDFILREVIPVTRERFLLPKDTQFILGGYSLAGLFALWAGYETDVFSGIAAASPSVWFENWDSFINKYPIRARHVYLSLGDREAKTRNQTMARVADRIHDQYEQLQKQGTDSTLEWNPGNHFRDPDARTARAFSWCAGRL